MSQPPYPPPGGNDPGGQQPGQQGWGLPEEPTRQLGQPAPPTTQFRPGQYGGPGAEQRGQTMPLGRPDPGQWHPQQYGQQYGQQPGHDPTQQFPQQYGQQYGPQYGQGYDPAQQYGRYGQQYGAPPGYGQPPPKSRRNLAIVLSIVGVLVVAGLAALLFFLLRDSGTPVADPTRTTSASSTSASPSPSASSSASPSPSASSSASPSPTSPSTTSAPRPTAPSSSAPPPPPSPGGGPTPPTGLGDDPTFQPLAQACFGGDFAACDRLWADTPVGSPYEEYAGTCAGRLPYEEQGTCEDRLG